jgi:hypothetical protein
MPYIITKTNGVQLASIDDATIDTTTDLFLVGRNYSGYGRVVNENFVKLLENFSSSTPPTKSLQGQLWYDSSAKSLHVYDGSNYKSLANVFIQSNTPSGSSTGDFWWDTEAQQLKAFNGSSYRLIGPPTSAADKSYWVSADITPLVGTQATNTVLEGFCGASPVVVISNDSFEPTVNNISTVFPQIYRGITLSGADPVTGVSANSVITAGSTGTEYILWGTAAHALNASTSDFTNGLNVTSTASGSSFYVTFADRSSTGASKAYVSSSMRYNAASNVLTTTATQAYYADLAERYEADGIYDKGTVLVIGGEKEVTTTETYGDTRVAGIVSTNPAYMMNSEAGNDETHPYIALKGRVPCKVVGTINKGDLLVTSRYPGYAASATSPAVGSVIGKALGSQSEGFGVVEVLVI